MKQLYFSSPTDSNSTRLRVLRLIDLKSCRSLFVLMAIGMVLLPGCGSSSSSDAVHWKGTITIDGAPLPEGTTGVINFRPQSARAKPVAAQIVDGKYDSPNTPKGKVTAYFSISSPTGKTRFSDRVQKEIPITKNIVPQDRIDGVQLEVSEDNLSKDIDL